MGCCGNNGPKPMFDNKPGGAPKVVNRGVVGNLINAGVSQTKPFHWFKDGLKGIIKCMGLKAIYKDEQIQANRDVCRDCEHSTKNDEGKLYVYSQCMAPDPKKDGAACGCFITCKTQVDKCPQEKWALLSINGKTPPDKNTQPEI